MQQENSPKARGGLRFLQHGERTLTTWLAEKDEKWFELVPDKTPKWLPKKLANKRRRRMARDTYRRAGDYLERTYGKTIIPQQIKIESNRQNQEIHNPDLFGIKALGMSIIDPRC